MWGIVWQYPGEDQSHFADTYTQEEAEELSDALHINGAVAKTWQIETSDIHPAELTKAQVDETGVQEEAILTPSQVAQIFRVDSRTVARWAERGDIRSFKTIGGHNRFRRRDVDKAMAQALAGGQIR